MIDVSHFRPGILVPHVSDLSADRKSVFESPIRFEYLYVDETMFFHLFNARVIQEINQSGSILIDEHEEEILKPDKMRDVISALEVFKSKKTHYDFVIDFTDNLIEMLDNAEKHNRPMYFIF